MSNHKRKFDWDEAQRLRCEGLTYDAIGARLGVSLSAVALALNPEQRARLRAQKDLRQRRGVCVDCGTRISSNEARPAARCISCSAKTRVKVRDGEAFCPACDSWKPLADFTPSSERTARGVRGECRSCSTARRRQNREANRERERAYDRARRRRERAAA